MNRACTFISMHPSNIIFFPLLFCRKSLTRWKCLRHCHKSHNVSPHTASDFLAQGLGQLLGRCAQETSDLFVTKATTTSQCPLHLVEMHIWYLKKKQKNPVLCPRFWWTSGLGNRYVCWKDRPSGIFHRERVTWSKWTKHNSKFTFKQRQTEMLTFPSLWLNENTHVGSQAEGSYAWGMHHQKQNNLEVLWKKDG